jgi:hypothetical protein
MQLLEPDLTFHTVLSDARSPPDKTIARGF